MKGKRQMTIAAAAFAACMLTACGGGSDTSTSLPEEGVIETPASDSGSSDSGSRILIAYFTVPETDGTDAEAGASRVAADGETMGNTELIAREIQSNTGGDLFAIETEQEYPGSHEELLDFAYEEKAENARPALATQIENLDNYDVIFVGYPKLEQGFTRV